MTSMPDDHEPGMNPDDGDFFALIDREITNWIAKDEGEGAVLRGTVVLREEWTSDYDGGPVPVVVVDPAEGGDLRRAVGYDTVLRNELSRQNPQAGDLIAVKYLGTKQGGKGDYASYKVLVRHKGAPAKPTDEDVQAQAREVASRIELDDDEPSF